MHSEIEIPAGDVHLMGDLDIPDGAVGVVVFVHGAGSSRFSERNRAVASALRSSGHLGTLLFDLLTPREDEHYQNRFDIDLLTSRLVAVTKYLEARNDTRSRRLGYFGASTGAAAALRAAARPDSPVQSVVSRGGRPDLAGADHLAQVRVPSLFIVGGADEQVLELNKRAAAQVKGPVQLEVVEGATHLFPEPGALDQVATLTLGWFEDTLVASEVHAHSTR